MTRRLFKEGGPHKIRNVGGDQYEMTVSLPTDTDCRMARQCPDESCSPGYFKVTPGTGITDGQELTYCPYCGREAEPGEFTTQEQFRYAEDVALGEAHEGIDEVIKDALGLGPSGRKKIGGGLLSMELSYKPGRRELIRRPFEDEVRRDVVCPQCNLDQTVFGLAVWCSDCGADIFLTHVSAEILVTKRMLSDIPRREEALGKRVAAKDLENCLEDAVSIFEASAKAMVRRALAERGDDQAKIDTQMKKIAGSFQSTERSKKWLNKLFAYLPTTSDVWERMGQAFEKRHPVTHNLGVVDRKYLERAQQAEREGREVAIAEDEVERLLAEIECALSDVHQALFGGRA